MSTDGKCKGRHGGVCDCFTHQKTKVNRLEVTVYDGKYTVIMDEWGGLKALRYGEKWRDCCGDGLILALAQEVDRLRKAVDVLAQ